MKKFKTSIFISLIAFLGFLFLNFSFTNAKADPSVINQKVEKNVSTPAVLRHRFKSEDGKSYVKGTKNSLKISIPSSNLKFSHKGKFKKLFEHKYSDQVFYEYNTKNDRIIMEVHTNKKPIKMTVFHNGGLEDFKLVK